MAGKTTSLFHFVELQKHVQEMLGIGIALLHWSTVWYVIVLGEHWGTAASRSHLCTSRKPQTEPSSWCYWGAPVHLLVDQTAPKPVHVQCWSQQRVEYELLSHQPVRICMWDTYVCVVYGWRGYSLVQTDFTFQPKGKKSLGTCVFQFWFTEFHVT